MESITARRLDGSVQSLDCTPETNITLDVNYSGIKIKNLIRKKNHTQPIPSRKKTSERKYRSEIHILTVEKRKCVDSTLSVHAEAGSQAGANGVGVLVEDKVE